MNSLEISINETSTETVLDPIITEKISHLIYLVKNTTYRLWIGIQLKKHLPDIADSYRLLQEKSTAGNTQFHQEFVQLQNLIKEDFLKTKEREWIDIFLEHQVSPLSLKSILKYTLPDDKLPPLKKGSPRVEKFLQRTQNRVNLHRQSFISEPISSISASLYQLYPNINDPFHSRMRIILKYLMNSNAVISNQIHHWTTMSNLQSMLIEGNIYGNAHLKNINKYFQKNSLSQFDISNGDSDVICFAPYLIDPIALVDEENYSLKTDLVRLTIDIEKAPYHWEMQHFFKIRDLAVPAIDYRVKVDNSLSFEFFHIRNYQNQDMLVIIKFKNWKIEHSINKSESIFYGNYFAINQFCMDQLPRMLKRSDSQFLMEFNDYLRTLTDNEIKKIFIIFAQSLTIYSEYNINHKLKLTNHLITHIYLANQNLLFDLSTLSVEDYQKACDQMCHSSTIPLTPTQNDKPIIKFNGKDLQIYGTEIWYRHRSFNLVKDFSELNPDHFGQEGYYETRPGLDTPASKISNNNNNNNNYKFNFG